MIDAILNHPFLPTRQFLTLSFYEAIKRALDIVVSVLAVLLLSPVLIVTAAAIKFDSRGPVMFGQTRVGRGGRTFRCWKFRSMVTNAETLRSELLEHNEVEEGVTFKMRRDPRITRVGRFIRPLSIDELPQLWNVILGEMTLVGPRPAIPSEVEQYTGYEKKRLAVTPGITCIWQVSGRSDIPFTKQVEMDLSYIAQRSLLLDLKLLFMTIPAVLSGRGAY